MKINLSAIQKTANAGIKKGINNLNKIGATAKNLGEQGIQKADSFIQNNGTLAKYADSARKAGVNKNTLIGASVFAVTLALAVKAFIDAKNKIADIRRKK